MLRVAKKYNTNLAAIRLSPHVQLMLPAWYHPKADTIPITSSAAKCLLRKHQTKTVGDLVKTAHRIRSNQHPTEHQPHPQCACRECSQDRIDSCTNPHACTQEAVQRILTIAPKYNPLEIGNEHDKLSLTKRRKERNRQAREDDDEIIFDPSITCKDNLDECLRIFTDPNKISHIPARRHHTRGFALRPRTIDIYTDGACWDNGKDNARCGSRIWIGHDHIKNAAIHVPGKRQSNQIDEIAAVIVAAESFPIFYPLRIITDSKYVIDGLTMHLPKWEDNGWIGVKNAKFLKKAAYLLKRRTAETRFKWVKGHQGNQGNKESDNLAKEGTRKEEPDQLSLSIPKDYDLQGAKLKTITQSLTYQGIRERAPQTTCPATERNLSMIKEAIHTYQNTWETTRSIWKSIKKHTIQTWVQQFLFKAIHSTQMVGEVWSHIPNHEQQSSCTTCQSLKSMEHILTRCNDPARIRIWQLAEEHWPHGQQSWLEINLGTILGCSSIQAQTRNDARAPAPRRDTKKKAATRLLQILISESAHLIWVIRCERVIQGKNLTRSEINARWLKAINRRLTNDKIATTKIRRDKPFTNLVIATWEEVLKKHTVLPFRWLHNREVLVGMRVQAWPIVGDEP